MSTEFLKQFEVIDEFLRNSAKGLLHKLDQMSFKATIDMLKANDPESVRIAIEQLAKEKNPMSIPPLYVVAKAHPSTFIQQKAKAALDVIDPKHEADKLAEGKEYKEAVYVLVQHYGNYKG